jgi:hypothetical protein
MADHLAPQPTQAQYPWRAALRTFVQVVIPAVVGFGLLVPIIISTFLGAAGDILTPEQKAWLIGVAAAVAAVAGGISRVMALPAVVAWTQKYLPWLAPQPTDRTN